MSKKIISLILCTFMFLSVFTSGYVLAEESYTEIYDRAGLEAISNNPNGNYRLMADINMDSDDWYPIEFNGIFEGNDHVLYNLSVIECNANPSESVDGNHLYYDTYYAGLFSKTENAVIKNLHLAGALVNINTPENCFAALLVGHAVNTDIIGCSVNGRVNLYTTSKMFGTGGIAGFGYGNIKDCFTDVVLVCVDENVEDKCEQFLGAVMACGYPNIENCTITMEGYASIHGYVHNGGMVGMHHIHTATQNQPTYVKNNAVDAEITFFEHNTNRRAYCKAYVGEKLNKFLTILDNTTVNYVKNELVDYDTVLLPGGCDQACEYEAYVTENTCTEWGYTLWMCPDCRYSYVADYTSPHHIQGDFVTAVQPTYDAVGMAEQRCTECSELLDTNEIAKLKYVDTITLSETKIEMEYKSTKTISAVISPEDPYNNAISWKSLDEDVAIIAATSGIINASGKGTTTIVCKSADGSAMATCEVEVKYSFKQWLIIIFLFGWIWY